MIFYNNAILLYLYLRVFESIRDFQKHKKTYQPKLLYNSVL